MRTFLTFDSSEMQNRLETVHVDWLNKTLTYHYDAAGRLIQTEQFNGSQTTYGYDDADRLTALNHTLGSQTLAGYVYTLDANGNRTQASVIEPKLPEQLINQAHSYSPVAQWYGPLPLIGIDVPN